MPPTRNIGRRDTRQTNEELDKIMFASGDQPPSYIGLQNSDDGDGV